MHLYLIPYALYLIPPIPLLPVPDLIEKVFPERFSNRNLEVANNGMHMIEGIELPHVNDIRTVDTDEIGIDFSELIIKTTEGGKNSVLMPGNDYGYIVAGSFNIQNSLRVQFNKPVGFYKKAVVVEKIVGPALLFISL